MSTDLFGIVPEPLVLEAPIPRGKHYTEPKGYAGRPGTGPEGKQCRHCAHYARVCGGAKSYPKCELAKGKWTHGRGSDILARSPSCSLFKEIVT